MKQGHDTVELKRGITAGGVTYTTVKLRVVPYMTEQQIKQEAEILERTPDGEWTRVASQQKYNQLMIRSSIEELKNNSGKTLRGDLARTAFDQTDDFHSLDARRLEEQLQLLNLIDMAEFGIIDTDKLMSILNDQETEQEEIIIEKRDSAEAIKTRLGQPDNASASGLRLDADCSNE